MGSLLERFQLSLLTNGNGISENFKNNSLFFYEKFRSSDKLVTNLPVGKIQIGGFYHLHYLDDSNWLKYSPIFTVDAKKFGNLIVLIGLNFNFIPIEIRFTIFDNFIKEEDFGGDRLLAVDYKGIYNELKRWGFEYSLLEYNIKQIKLVHKISLDLLPRFLCSAHPQNKYDPVKLYSIWKAKIGNQSQRDEEISKSLISDFYKASDEILGSYKSLKGHIERVKNSFDKFG